MMHLCKILQV